jgi:bifunctional ADP-heptose synthase (sugar kinase/adenylyltransferase)
MKFLVIGDSCTDIFIYGKCERICPEAPVPVFEPVKETRNGGMAANVKANVEALDVKCDIITHSNEIFKTRYVDIKTNQMLLRVDEDDTTEEKFNYRDVDYKKYDAILVSDYGKGFVNGLSDVRSICLYHNNVFLDSNKVKMTTDLPINLRFLKINEQELEINPHIKDHLLESRSCQDISYTRPDQIVVTLGHKGCKYMGKTYPPPQRVITQDLSGAGDTFMAALAVATMKIGDVEAAIKFANECACEVVQKRGVATI